MLLIISANKVLKGLLILAKLMLLPPIQPTDPGLIFIADGNIADGQARGFGHMIGGKCHTQALGNQRLGGQVGVGIACRERQTAAFKEPDKGQNPASANRHFRPAIPKDPPHLFVQGDGPDEPSAPDDPQTKTRCPILLHKA